MRKADVILDIIRNRGKKGLNLEDVYRQLFNAALYLEAYARIYRNDGSMTKGVTQETVDGMSVAKIEGIIDLVRQERFRWTPVRRTYIPKSNGKMRPLGIPTWSDKLLQEVMRRLLDAYYEPQFSDLSHGFRPGRLIQRLLADRCEHCGSKGKVEIHHVRKLKDLHRPGRNARPLWVHTMIARRRKTLALCEKCHDDLHAGRLDGRPQAGSE